MTERISDETVMRRIPGMGVDCGEGKLRQEGLEQSAIGCGGNEAGWGEMGIANPRESKG